MRWHTLIRRALVHYWRTNAAVVVGVATAVAVLGGALLVGDSVRDSLRDLVLQRLGSTDRAVVSAAFFREALADDVRGDDQFAASFSDVCPIIVMQGLATTGRSASRVQVYGVDDRFWRFHRVSGITAPVGREALISRAAASEIGATVGGAVLVRVERPSEIPLESLHGRKDNPGRTLRLTTRAIVVGDFSLSPQQGDVRAVFVPLRRLQQDLGLASRVNTLLVSDRPGSAVTSAALESVIRRRWALEDVGVDLRVVAGGSAVAVQGAAGLLDRPRATAANEAAAATGMRAQPVMTYLANTLRTRDRQVPYSLVAATDLGSIAPHAANDAGQAVPPVIVNDWTARNLDAKVGDLVTLEYYVWEDPGRLLERRGDFRIAAIVPISGAAADRDLAPVYPGITEARTLGEWDPPFPIDLRRIRPVDEEYWTKFRTTPKAFIPFDVGRRLWGSRFGDRTSVRLVAERSESVGDARNRVAAALRTRLDPIALGLSVRDVRADGLAASRGSTDFSEYFTYFSFFLVVSAVMLAALFFRLGVEQRAREVGLLRAVGFTTASVRRLFLGEGIVLAAIGSLLGVLGAIGYGAVMVVGLRTWWSDAVGTTLLRLHVAPGSLTAGAAAAMIVAVVCIWWTLRSLSRLSERGLLAGQLLADKAGVRRSWMRPLAGALGFAIAGVLLVASSLFGSVSRDAAFFGAGMSFLIACLSAVALGLRRPLRSSVVGRGWLPVWRIGVRNAADRPGRSVLAIGVIASAAFILIGVSAFRRDAPAPTDRHSGIGGYALLVDLLLPLATDPNSRDGREMLGLSGVDDVAIEPFRVRPGDDASCLNLYEPRNPRILGVTRSFVESGRFAFQRSLASSDAERANSWLLLNRDFGADVVPVIADANSMTYVLHKRLGDDIVVTTGVRLVRLRLVAALADSIFQRELLMSDANFVGLFPEQEGYQFLLVDAPADRAPRVAAAIEEQGSQFGADAVDTQARLAEFHVVENTYLSTFQTLGGLGLLVGTVGLAAVVLRNVLERRRELALLGAVGYSRLHIFTIVIAENLLLLGWGLAIGSACAMMAIAPAIVERGQSSTTSIGAMLLLAVFFAGVVSSAIATQAATRAPLVEALRSE